MMYGQYAATLEVLPTPTSGARLFTCIKGSRVGQYCVRLLDQPKGLRRIGVISLIRDICLRVCHGRDSRTRREYVILS